MNPSTRFPFPSQLENLSRRLKEDKRICAAYLHGSAVKGGMRPNSDVDIALLLVPGQHLTTLERLELSADLEIVLGRSVDIGILSTNNVVYAKEVAAGGQILFTKNQLESDRFIAHALSMYAELQSSRQEILKAYAI